MPPLHGECSFTFHMTSNGRRFFLFTAGDEDGSKQGEPMNGVPFHYWSFTVEGYRELLEANDLTLLDVRRDDGKNVYYLGRKGRSVL